MTCPICGKEFTPKQKHMKTCSRSCGAKMGNITRNQLIFNPATHRIPPRCKRCQYRRPLDYNSLYDVCHYAIDTGTLRDCPPEECTKFKPKRRERHVTMREVLPQEQM